MKKASEIRNFAVAGHSGGGKTSLCDQMLFKAGVVERCGCVDQKTSVSDYTHDEQEKRCSIYATPVNCPWKNQHFFFTDTPGYGEYIGETIAALYACNGVLIVVDAIGGLEVGCAKAWSMAAERNLPRMILINRIDREHSDFNRTLSQLQDAYGKTLVVPVTLPVGSEASFKKVVNVLSDDEIPAEIADDAANYREMLMDAIAESDTALMEKYLEGTKLTPEEIAAGMKTAVNAGTLVPVFAGSAVKDIGITELMDAIAAIMPDALNGKEIVHADGSKTAITDAGPGIGMVFKTIIDPFIGQLTIMRVLSGVFSAEKEIFNISRDGKERVGQLLVLNGREQKPVVDAGPGSIIAIAKLKDTHICNTMSMVPNIKPLPFIQFPNPVMSYAISAVKSGEEDKITSALHKITETDPTANLKRQDETHEMLLSGMGDQHLGNIVRKLKDSYKVDVHLATPKIPYRETIMASGEGHYRHKKQSGGHGQFGEVLLRMSYNDAGYEFVNDVVGGSIPKNFIPAVEKGIVEAMTTGPLAGCVVEKIKVSVYDGKFHAVDSSEMAFKIAARMAFRDAMSKAKPVLLEPIMKVKITIPDHYMGDITGDLNHKRGRILGMDAAGGMQVVNAEIPLSEMAKYATELRSMTQGRGLFEMEFSRYEQVPSIVANEIIAKYQAEKQHHEEE